MKSFRTLDLAVQFYSLARGLKLPVHHRDQFIRAASSIALNLSEGNAKMSTKEKRRFYEIAFGSLRECQTILLLETVDSPELAAALDRLAASLFKLIQSMS